MRTLTILTGLAMLSASAADLSVRAVVHPGSVTGGSLITVSAIMDATPAASNVSLAYYLSLNDEYDLSDTLLGRTSGNSGAAAPLTTRCPGVIPGGYHVIVLVDPNNSVIESNEANNVAVSTSLLTVRASKGVNLSRSAQTIAPVGLDQGALMSAIIEVSNGGTMNAGPFTVRFRLSTDTFYSPSTDVFLGDVEMAGLASGQATLARWVGTLPTTVQPGYYYVVACIDIFDEVMDTSEFDNFVDESDGTEVKAVKNGANPPVILSSNTSKAAVGAEYIYFFSVADTTLPTFFFVTALPPGLEMNLFQDPPPSGIISGTPTQEGIYEVTLVAANDAGLDILPLTITVSKQGTQLVRITELRMSRNPVRTGVPVQFDIIADVPPTAAPVAFGISFSDDTDKLIFAPSATRTFTTEGTVTVFALATEDRSTFSVQERIVSVTLSPTATEAQNVTAGTVVVNPIDGLAIGVPETDEGMPGSLGGVVSVDVALTEGASALKRGVFFDEVKTTFSRAGRPLANQESTNRNGKGAAKFSNEGIFVAEATARGGDGITRRARRMIPVGRVEAGGSASSTLQSSVKRPIFDTKLSGKFNFGNKLDAVTLSGKFVLPAGADLRGGAQMSFGVGNVVADLKLDERGRAIGLPAGVKSFKLTLPKLPKNGLLVTTSNGVAKFTITLSGLSLDRAGFDTEGVVKNVKNNDTGERNIQAAIVFAGVPYYTQIPNVIYSVKDDVGQFVPTRSSAR